MKNADFTPKYSYEENAQAFASELCEKHQTQNVGPCIECKIEKRGVKVEPSFQILCRPINWRDSAA